MSTSLWVFYVLLAFGLGLAVAFGWGLIQNKRGYKEGYSNGYKNGANDQYRDVFKKRLLKQSKRTAARERKLVDIKPEEQETEELDLGLKKSESTLL